MNLDIIVNVCIGMFVYNIILASFGNVLIKHFLENNETVQKEKKSFRDRVSEKLKESKSL